MITFIITGFLLHVEERAIFSDLVKHYITI